MNDRGKGKLFIEHEFINNEKILVVRYNSHNIYLIGSSHTNSRYIFVVKQAIERINPEVIGVELCKTRVGYKHIVSTSTELITEFDFDSLPVHKREPAIGEKLRLLYAYGAIMYSESKKFRVRLQKYRNLRRYKLENPARAGNILIGAELYVPFKNYMWRSDLFGTNYLTNTISDYKILLLDRPVEDTYRLMAEALTDEEKILVKRYKRDFSVYFLSNNFEKETLMSKLWVQNPTLKEIFIDQRDKYMANTIFKAVTQDKVKKLLCVIGKSHISGILNELKIKFQKFQ